MAIAWATETTVDEDGHAILAVEGELDIATAPRLRGTVGDLMGQGVRHLEIDLDGCTFIDSTGMGALLWAAHRLEAVGGDLCALHVHGPPAEAIAIAGLDHVIPMRN